MERTRGRVDRMARRYQAYYAANREQRIAASKAWNSAHSDRVHARAKAWREANPDRVRANHKAWRVANPERVRISVRTREARRRARIARVLSTLTAQEWEVVLEAAGRACIYCGGGDRLSMDHLTPISRGGPHTSENVAPACLPCNLSKGAKTVMEFLAEEEAL